MKGFLFALITLFAMVSFASVQPRVPDGDMTPGQLCNTKNPDFTEYRYGEQIPYCERNVSSETKREIYMAYGVSLKKRRSYTVDHLIPLSIGGDNSVKNLWPEHRKIKELRKYLEQDVFDALRDGEISQKEAVDIILEAKFNPPIEVRAFQDILY